MKCTKCDEKGYVLKLDGKYVSCPICEGVGHTENNDAKRMKDFKYLEATFKIWKVRGVVKTGPGCHSYADKFKIVKMNSFRGASEASFDDTVEGMWTYSIREFSKLQTNYFLYWKMIERYCNKGYKLFHLGRSSSESGGIFYKKKWNAVPKQLYWEYALNRSNKIPELNVDNPKYEMAINLWRKLPVRITQLVGPHIAKNIP